MISAFVKSEKDVRRQAARLIECAGEHVSKETAEFIVRRLGRAEAHSLIKEIAAELSEVA